MLINFINFKILCVMWGPGNVSTGQHVQLLTSSLKINFIVDAGDASCINRSTL